MGKDNSKDGFVFVPGTDIGGPVFDGAPCIVCHKDVAKGEGAQAVPPLPAIHSACLDTFEAAVRDSLTIEFQRKP